MFAASIGSSASTLQIPIPHPDPVARPRISTEAPLRPDSNQRILQFDPDLESELHASRVYVRTMHRQSMSSLSSKHNSVAGLSFLSGISLAQMSSISVISLPIFSHELWNPQQYSDMRSTRMSAGLKIQENNTRSSKIRSGATGTEVTGLAHSVSTGLQALRDGFSASSMGKPRRKEKFTAERRRIANSDWISDEEKPRLKYRTNILMLGEYNHASYLRFSEKVTLQTKHVDRPTALVEGPSSFM